MLTAQGCRNPLHRHTEHLCPSGAGKQNPGKHRLAERSTAHLQLLLLLEYLLQASGVCTILFISLGPLACAALTEMSQVCFGRGCFLAGARPISTASSQAPEQMTTNVNKARVMFWKQTLSWCK